MSSFNVGVKFGPDDDKYEIIRELGAGSAAKVFACKHLRTGGDFAVKVFDMRKLRLTGDFDGEMMKLRREAKILEALRHQNIVFFSSHYEYEDTFLMVMEYIAGGELFNQIAATKGLAELEAKHIFRQLLDAVGYMHSQGIIHRDLKPENILMASSTGEAGAKLHTVKIADFGLSKVVSGYGASVAKTFLGTPQYWAPEVLNVERGGGSYDQTADFWSLGVVLYVMLSGRYPFDGKKAPRDQQILSASFEMAGARWNGVSEEAKDLLRGLLRVDVKARFNFEKCRGHPWLTPVAKEPASVPKSTPQATEAALVQLPQQTGTASDTEGGIFDVKEFLKAQLALAQSLEYAYLYTRHADAALANQIQDSLHKARTLSNESASVARSFAETAEFVNSTMLQDLRLAVSEGVPEMAVEILSRMGEDVASMKRKGEDLQAGYGALMKMVQALEPKARDIKLAAEGDLQELQVQAIRMTLDAPDASNPGIRISRSPVHKASNAPEASLLQLTFPQLPEASLAIQGDNSSMPVAEGTPASRAPTSDSIDSSLLQLTFPAPADALVALQDERANMQLALNDATQKSLARLDAMLNMGDAASLQTAVAAGAEAQCDAAGSFSEALLLAPSCALASFHRASRLGAAQGVQWSAIGDVGPKPAVSRTEHEQAVDDAIFDQGMAGWQARVAVKSAQSLLRAMSALRRVDDVLETCSSFWSSMDRTVRKLDQMKGHTQVMVRYVANSSALRERFLQRVNEYDDFWMALANCYRTYHADLQAQAPEMWRAIREADDSFDKRDSQHSLELGQAHALAAAALKRSRN